MTMINCDSLRQRLTEYKIRLNELSLLSDTTDLLNRLKEVSDEVARLEGFFATIKEASSATQLSVSEIERMLDSALNQPPTVDELLQNYNPEQLQFHLKYKPPPSLKDISSLLSQEIKEGKMGLFGTRPVQPIVNAGKKLKKNQDCICGSGKKFKNCCLNKHLEQRLIASNSKEQKDATDSS